MDHILNCKKDCTVISGDKIEQEEIEKLKEKLGENVFSEINELKMKVERRSSDVNDNDIVSLMVGLFLQSKL